MAATHPSPGQPRHARPTAATLLLSSWLVALTGCASADPPRASRAAAAPTSPDLVLLLVAGVRADIGEGAGAQGAGTALFEGAGLAPEHRYGDAYAHALSPLGSLASVLAGRYPSAIPFCGLHDRDALPTERLWCAALPADRHYLPGVLSAYGYRTALLSSGLAGHDIVDGLFDHTVALDGDTPAWATLARRAGDWWRDAADAPRLLTLVVADLGLERHPALTPAGEVRTVRDETGAARRVLDEATAVPAYHEVVGDTGRGLADVLAALGDDGDRPRWLAVASLHGLSVGERSGVTDASDTQIEWQLSHLAHHIVLDRTVRVPLALDAPGDGPATRRDGPVQLVDLYPTLLRLAGAEVPGDLPGTDLLAATPASERSAGRAYVEFGDMLALREGDRLLTFRAYIPNRTALDPVVTEALRLDAVDAEKYALHDLAADPWQTRNQLHHDWAAAVEMRARLIEIRGRDGAPPQGVSGSRLDAIRLSPEQGYW